MSLESNFVSQKKLPFRILQANFNTWIGGQPGVKGYQLNLIIDSKEINLDSAYFRNLKASFKRNHSEENTTFVAVFIAPNKIHDMILHEDPKKEFGNQPQKMQQKIPFELKEDEAVITFRINEKTYYHKLFDLKEVNHIRLDEPFQKKNSSKQK